MTTPTFQDTNHLQMAANARLKEAEALSILSAEDLDAASGMFNATKGDRDGYERERVAEKEPHLEAGRQVDAKWKPILTTLDSAASIVASKIRTFRAEAQLRAEEEQRRLRAEQEKERLRLAKQAEKAEARGLPETADALIREAETMQPAIVQSAMPKRVEGLGFAENWTFEIEDESKLPREYLVPDRVAIGKTVKALKGRTAIAGVRAFNQDSIRRR